jgi:hypothetical protein
MGAVGGWFRTSVVVVAALGAALLGGCADSEDDGGDGSAEASSTTGAARSGELSVLAYNVAGLPQEVSQEQPSTDIPLISPMLEPFDLVLTEEDFDWWSGAAAGLDFVNYHDRLRAEVTHEYQSTQHPGPDAVGLDLSAGRQPPEVGDGLGMLSRLPMEEVARVPWIGCFGGFDTSDGGAGDCLAMKGFSLVTVTLADGLLVDVYNLHGEAGGTETDQALQADGYVQLAAYITEHSEGRAIILGGDTNLHTDDEHPDGSNGADTEIWEAFLEATGLTDACTATECPSPGRIDKFAFRSGGGVELEALSHEFLGDEFVDPAGDPLSDHEPLEVRFRWSAV